MTTRYAFDMDTFTEGTPVNYKEDINDHYIHGLVSDVTEDELTLFCGFYSMGISIEEAMSGKMVVYSLDDPGAPTEIEVECFDVPNIPVGSLLISPKGKALIITNVFNFEIFAVDHNGHETSLKVTDSKVMEYEIILREIPNG